MNTKFELFAMMMIIIWTNPPTSSPQHIISCRFWFLFHSKILSLLLFFGYNLVLFLFFPRQFLRQPCYYFFFFPKKKSVKKKKYKLRGERGNQKSVIMIFFVFTLTLSHARNLYVKKKRWILLLSWRSMSNFLQERFFGKGIFSSYSPGGVVYKQMCNECFCFRGQERKIYKETTPSRVVGQEDGGGGHTHTAGFLSSF